MTTRIFEGRFNIRLNTETGVISLAKATDGNYTAEAADWLVETILTGAKKHKADLDRWSFYIKDVNQKLAEGENLKASELQKAVKAGFKPVIKAGKWGKPRLDMVNPEAPSAKQNDNIVLL
jgi:hypothetical protein